MPCFLVGSHHCQEKEDGCPSRVLSLGFGIAAAQPVALPAFDAQQPGVTFSLAADAQHVKRLKRPQKGAIHVKLAVTLLKVSAGMHGLSERLGVLASEDVRRSRCAVRCAELAPGNSIGCTSALGAALPRVGDNWAVLSSRRLAFYDACSYACLMVGRMQMDSGGPGFKVSQSQLQSQSMRDSTAKLRAEEVWCMHSTAPFLRPHQLGAKTSGSVTPCDSSNPREVPWRAGLMQVMFYGSAILQCAACQHAAARRFFNKQKI